MTQERATEKVLAEKMQEFQENVKSFDEEVKRCRNLRDNLHTAIEPLRVSPSPFCSFLLISIFLISVSIRFSSQ